MFQDEARFGRMVRLRRCWAPAPLRPTVPNGYERQFIYAYGAVSPVEGQLDWKISSNMNTDRMNEFLCQVSAAHPDEFIVMVVDGASSHTSREVRIPENICLLRLPPYSPELNPQEHVWDELREKEFPNRVFDSLEGVVGQLESGLRRLSADHEGLRSLTGWPWIVSINLIATQNKEHKAGLLSQLARQGRSWGFPVWLASQDANKFLTEGAEGTNFAQLAECGMHFSPHTLSPADKKLALGTVVDQSFKKVEAALCRCGRLLTTGVVRQFWRDNGE